MNITVLTHVPFEGPGIIVQWAEEAGHDFDEVRLYANDPLPALDDVDLVVSMGGPMGVEDEIEYPFLGREREFLAAAIWGGRRVLGICLGAQQLAMALGAEVMKNRQAEVGFYPVELTEQGREHELFRGFPDAFEALHWHSDTFTLPNGAVHAMSSNGCAHQAFVHAGRGVGLQFHLEITAQGLEALLSHCGGEIVPATFVQSAEDLRAQTSRLDAMHGLLFGLLDRLTES